MMSAEETDQQSCSSQNSMFTEPSSQLFKDDLTCQTRTWINTVFQIFQKYRHELVRWAQKKKTTSGREETDADKMMSSMGSHHEDSACKNSPAMHITASDSNDAERNKTGGNEPSRFMDDWTSWVSWTWFRYGRQSRHRYLKANAVWHQGSQKEPIIFKLSLAPLDR